MVKGKMIEKKRICIIIGVVGIVVGIIVGIIVGRWLSLYISNEAIISIAFSLIAIVISLIAFNISLSSEQKMKALTKLNFDEKMAMMTGYRTEITYFKKKRDMLAERIKNNELVNLGDAISAAVDRYKYDLRAISHLIPWAEKGDKEKLIEEYAIEIIENSIEIYQKKYGGGHEKDFLKNICAMINSAFDIDSNIWGKSTKIKAFKKKVCGDKNDRTGTRGREEIRRDKKV